MKQSKPGELFNAHKKMAMKKKHKSMPSFSNRGQMVYGKNSPNLSTQGLANSGFGGVNTMKRAKKRHKNWIAGAIQHPGALHRELGVKEGHKIPTKKLATAAKKGGKVGARARLAETLKGFHHKKHKKMNDHDKDDMKKKAMKCKKMHKHTKACK